MIGNVVLAAQKADIHVGLAGVRERAVNLPFVHDPIVRPARIEMLVCILHPITGFNGCFGDVRCIAAETILQV